MLLMPISRPVLMPASAADALATAAAFVHAGSALARGGAAQKFIAMLERDHHLEDALESAIHQGKGHAGELLQCCSFSSRAGAFGRSARAALSNLANDPTTDIVVRCSSRRRAGYQIKVGSSAYAARAARNPKYARVGKVVNAEALDDLKQRGRREARCLRDRVAHRGTEATALTETDATDLVSRTLLCDLLNDAQGLEGIVSVAAKAGCKDFLASFSFSLLVGLVESAHHGTPFNVKEIATNAAKLALKGAIRTTMQTGLLVHSYLQSVQETFSSKILHRVSRSTFALGAVAEWVVEAAIDLFALMRGVITLEELLRRAGVHAFAAIGAGLAGALAAELVQDLPWWAQLVAIAGAGYGGGVLGHACGQAIFFPVPQLSTRGA